MSDITCQSIDGISNCQGNQHSTSQVINLFPGLEGSQRVFFEQTNEQEATFYIQVTSNNSVNGETRPTTLPLAKVMGHIDQFQFNDENQDGQLDLIVKRRFQWKDEPLDSTVYSQIIYSSSFAPDVASALNQSVEKLYQVEQSETAENCPPDKNSLEFPECSLFHEETLPGDLGWEVQQLKWKVNDLEWSDRTQDRKIRDLERRVQEIEKHIQEEEKTAVCLPESHDQDSRLDDLESRVSDLESNFDDLESRVDDLE